MKYLNKLRPMYLFGAFILGIIYVYLIQPGFRYIVKHPTPENAGKIIYNEKGNCFVYKLINVDCPVNKETVNNQPVSVRE